MTQDVLLMTLLQKAIRWLALISTTLLFLGFPRSRVVIAAAQGRALTVADATETTYAVGVKFSFLKCTGHAVLNDRERAAFLGAAYGQRDLVPIHFLAAEGCGQAML